MAITKKKLSIEIDADGQSLGRVASVAAHNLRGKHLPDFAQNVLPGVKVKIKNVTKLRFTGTKLKVNLYHRYSGYPGGLKTTTLEQEFIKNPVALVRQAVEHMLPKNRLQSRFMNNLTITR
ncbi:MAG: 50S ribosomal protein L13 [Patescibacteria group bacterium]